jgi:hypothetical protein
MSRNVKALLDTVLSNIKGLRRAEAAVKGGLADLRLSQDSAALARDGDETGGWISARNPQRSRRPSPRDRESTKKKTSTISD